MTRVRSESGAINILNVIIMLVLLIALGFAFELSAALDQQNAQTNDCSAARDATMASQNLLVAKNSDDPGLAIATAAVKSLRANGFNGEVEVWFYEAPSSAVPQSKRAWAWGIQTKSSLKGYFATYSLGDFNIPIGSHVTAHAVPYTAGKAWRPADSGNGKYSFKAGYHITQESKYMDKAKQVINYAATSDRCLRNGILRDEGSSMDQSIFKSVYIPYAVNLALDEASSSIGKHLITFLKNNAETLRMNLNHAAYPAMYCNYWWGEMWKSSEPASMGAQVSGASLMEGIARLE